VGQKGAEVVKERERYRGLALHFQRVKGGHHTPKNCLEGERIARERRVEAG